MSDDNARVLSVDETREAIASLRLMGYIVETPINSKERDRVQAERVSDDRVAGLLDRIDELQFNYTHQSDALVSQVRAAEERIEALVEALRLADEIARLAILLTALYPKDNMAFCMIRRSIQDALEVHFNSGELPF